MSKKKEEEEVYEETEEENFEDDYDDNDEKIEDENEVIDSSLEIGGQIHQQSDVVKKFYHLPKDVKYSKFNRIDIANFTLKSRAYDLFQYVRKIQSITKEELNNIREQRKQLFYIETLEELQEYLKETNKLYLWDNLRNLTDEELKKAWVELKEQLNIAKETGFVDQIYGDKDTFYNSYESHISNYDRDSNLLDDFGLMSTMMTLTEVNKAQKGWATKMMNTTISETKNEDLTKEVEESPEDNESGGNFKKFFKK